MFDLSRWAPVGKMMNDSARCAYKANCGIRWHQRVALLAIGPVIFCDFSSISVGDGRMTSDQFAGFQFKAGIIFDLCSAESRLLCTRHTVNHCLLAAGRYGMSR